MNINVLLALGRPTERAEDGDRFAGLLGAGLAKENVCCITPGTKGRPSDIAAEAFEKSSKEGMLITYLPKEPLQEEDVGHKYIQRGRTYVLDRWPWERRKRMVKESDIVLLMGGYDGTAHNYRLALEYKKKIIAIPHFGGAAADAFLDQIKLYDYHHHKELSDLYMKFGYINQDPETLSRNVVSTISALGKITHRYVFLAMPFSDKYEERDLVEETVTRAARDVLDWDVLLARDTESGFNRSLTTVIRDMIDQASILVADLNEGNLNVIYEAGYAHGFGIPSVLIKKGNQDIPFSVSNFEIIAWNDERELLEKLKKAFQRVSLRHYGSEGLNNTNA